MNDSVAAAVLERPAFVPGVFDDWPSARYHQLEALSASGAKKLLQSPQHFRLWRDTQNEPTPAMQFGTAVHDGVLEDAFADRVVCAPDVDKRTKAGKAEHEAFCIESAGKLILAPDAHYRARRCIDAVKAHPAAQKLLHGAQTELSLCWYDGKLGVPCKARFDARNHGGVVDLKTTTDASPEAFAKRAADLLYHVSAAHYMSGAEHVLNETPQFFAWIVVESEAPYGVACYLADGPTVLAGAHLMNRALERYRTCLDAGAWPGYPDVINRLAFPRWALRFNE